MSQSVDEALAYVLLTLDIVAEMATRPTGYDEVAEEEIRIRLIISRAQLILNFIEAGKPTPKTVGRVN